jgi:hypothetical protein
MTCTACLWQERITVYGGLGYVGMLSRGFRKKSTSSVRSKHVGAEEEIQKAEIQE